jgi:DNA-directed RNA polymerase subunit RPC12/RpoP
MISREETVTFVWRCPDCSAEYEGEGLLFLHTDETHWHCPCGGRLVEDVEPATERHYRLVIPETLRGTLLHRQLELREAVEVTVGGRREHIDIFCNN